MGHTRIFRLGIVLALGVLLIGAALSGCDSDDQDEQPSAPRTSETPIVVSDPWVRATAPVAAAGESGGDEGEMIPTPETMNEEGMAEAPAGPVTGAFMMIQNNGTAAQRLIRAAVDPAIARTVEIHETTVGDDQVMRMRPVDGIDIPAGGSAQLKPGGYHIMLIDVQQALNPGDTVRLTLTFASGLELAVDAPVREMGGM